MLLGVADPEVQGNLFLAVQRACKYVRVCTCRLLRQLAGSNLGKEIEGNSLLFSSLFPNTFL